MSPNGKVNAKLFRQRRCARGLCVVCGKIAKRYRCFKCALKHAAEMYQRRHI